MELVAPGSRTGLRRCRRRPSGRGGDRPAARVFPLDADRRAEMEVWLYIASRALVDPSLRELRDEAHTGVRGVAGGP